MLAWVIQMSIISIIFIVLVHHILLFFKTTLTVPKIKDLVNLPNQKYKNIYDTIANANENANYINENTNSYTAIDLLPTENTMKDELKSFLKKQLNNDNDYVFNSN